MNLAIRIAGVALAAILAVPALQAGGRPPGEKEIINGTDLTWDVSLKARGQTYSQKVGPRAVWKIKYGKEGLLSSADSLVANSGKEKIEVDRRTLNSNYEFTIKTDVAEPPSGHQNFVFSPKP